VNWWSYVILIVAVWFFWDTLYFIIRVDLNLLFSEIMSCLVCYGLQLLPADGCWFWDRHAWVCFAFVCGSLPSVHPSVTIIMSDLLQIKTKMSLYRPITFRRLKRTWKCWDRFFGRNSAKMMRFTSSINWNVQIQGTVMPVLAHTADFYRQACA